uniref:Uncharacterized protein n=1 Tax=Glossina austeni TaxID=7395 RepID=A0A1A9VTC2_GLOAU
MVCVKKMLMVKAHEMLPVIGFFTVLNRGSVDPNRICCEGFDLLDAFSALIDSYLLRPIDFNTLSEYIKDLWHIVVKIAVVIVVIVVIVVAIAIVAMILLQYCITTQLQER